MNKDNKIHFEFTRLEGYYALSHVKSHYQSIFDAFNKQILNSNDEVVLKFEDLNHLRYNHGIGTYSEIKEENILRHLMPYGSNLRISLSYKNNNFNNLIFEFFMYNQNNCCGAMSVSKTIVHRENKKLGHILQHLKEDIALTKGMSMLTCTDTYHVHYSYTNDSEMYKLKPYLRNTKVLLNNGWEISKLFYNKNSRNVVGLFTKDIVLATKKRTVIMEIELEKKLVKIEKVSVGCDPELFLRSKDSKEFVPSFSIIKGDKNNPTPISEKGHNIQCDNVMVEYGVPPSKTAEEFVENNMFVQDYLKNKVAEPNNLELFIFPFAEFNPNELKSDRAQAFGCDPDFDVWNDGRPNEVGRAGHCGRCAGGHIHIGYDNHNRVTSNYIIKALDLFLSTPLVLMEPDNRRKEMYGKAGSYRPQPWGVEYRSTSNYIFSSPELMKWAFNQVQKAIQFVNNDDSRKLLDSKGSIIVSAINNKDKRAAKDLIERFNIEVLEAVLIK